MKVSILALEIALTGSFMATQTQAADLNVPPAPPQSSSFGTLAPPPPAPDVPTTGLTGDWNGERTWFFNHGIDFQLSSVNQVGSNVVSQASPGVASNGENDVGATFDLRKLLGLDGSKVQVTITDRYGNEIGAVKDLGLLMEAQSYYGRGDIFRLTRFDWEQAIAGNTFNLKFGRLNLGDDFASFNCEYQNLTFCGPPPNNYSADWRSWPISQWGTRLRANFGSAGYVEAGAYEINDRDLEATQLFNFNLNPTGGKGVLLPVEVAWTPAFANGSLPGSYKVGGWYDSSSQEDIFESTLYQAEIAAGTLNPASFDLRGAYGVTVNVRQQLTPLQNGSHQGLSGFLNFAYLDPRTAPIDNQWAVGLSYTGLIPDRPNDELNFGFGRTHENNAVAAAQAILNSINQGPGFVQGTESAIELNYGVAVAKGLVVRPNIQYIVDPGGVSDHKNVVVLGVMTTAQF